jgi:hypothetical protein
MLNKAWPMVSAAAGAADKFTQGAGGSMISAAVQGATIGQMLAPAFGVSPKSMYVIPGGTLAQNPQDYALSNYYATMNMGVAPNTPNWSTVQKGAQQLMALVPNMSRQGAMQAQNAMQQPQTINSALAVGLNLRPGGQLQTPEQQYAQIFNRLTMGGKVDAKTFEAMMAPGGPGQVNLASLGYTPGSDQYLGFMQYSLTRLGMQKQGKSMVDVGTAAGVSAAGLNTPYMSQLQAQSAKSQLESRAEPGLAQAAKNLNQAAASLLKIVGPLGSLFGGAIGGASKMLGPVNDILKLFTGGKFQSGGTVDGPLNKAMLAIVHGGERVITPGMGAEGQSSLGGSCGCGKGFGGFPGLGSIGNVLGDVGGFFKHLLGGIHMPSVGSIPGAGLLGRVGGDIGQWGEDVGQWGKDVGNIPGKAFGAVDRFGRRIGGDVMGAGEHAKHDITNWLKDIPIIGALFGGSVFGAAKGTVEHAKHDITNWLKEVPIIGALFGGSIFGGAKGLVHGAGHRVSGAAHTVGHWGSSLFQGAEHLGSSLLHGVTGLFGHHKKGGDTAIEILSKKLSDIKDTALYSLLTPVPKGSILEALTTGPGGGKPVAPTTPQHQQPAPKQTGPQPSSHKGGISGFLGGLGSALGGLGQQLFGVSPAAAATTTPSAPKTSAAYQWTYQRPTNQAVDLSWMYAGGSSTTQTSSGNGGTPNAGSPASAGGGANATGSSNAQKAYNFLLAKGLTDFQAAGVVGNFVQESHVDPTTAGGGIAQWIGSRWTALTALAKQENKPTSDLGVQLDYLWQELTGPEAGSLSALRASTDVVSAATAFQTSFERAGIPMMQNRIKYAQNILASKGASYARGTQLIARNQLAMLHRGEAVIPAADNYSAMPYNKNGAVGGSGAVHLDFRAGSVVLQVPANATQSQMEDIANQFVKAISKPQLLTAARSQ